MSPLDKAIENAGGLSAFTQKLNAVLTDEPPLSPNQVGNWRRRGVPTEYCAAVETASGGETTRKMLRPKDWQHIWPELVESGKRRRRASDLAIA